MRTTEASILESPQSDGVTDPLPRGSSQANGEAAPVLRSTQSDGRNITLCPGGTLSQMGETSIPPTHTEATEVKVQMNEM